MQGSGCRVQGSGFRVQGAEFRVQGAGLRIQGTGDARRPPRGRRGQQCGAQTSAASIYTASLYMYIHIHTSITKQYIVYPCVYHIYFVRLCVYVYLYM